ncbi:MAG: hypothetical protein AAFV25_04365 [Bacteroidota bacterium]
MSKEHPLIELLQSLDHPEQRKLYKLLHSPYFNQREDVIRLYDYWRKHCSKANKPFDKRQAFGVVFPTESVYKDGLMRYALSFLLDACRRFLVLEELEASPRQAQLLLCRALRKKGGGQVLGKTLERTTRQKMPQSSVDAEHHLLSYQLAAERFHQQYQQKRADKIAIGPIVEELTIYYATELLRWSATSLIRERLSGLPFEHGLLQSVLEYAKEYGPSHPTLNAYRLSYRALTDDRSESFDRLLDLIESQWQAFPPSDLKDIYLLAINFCIRQLNTGQRAFIRQGFELYRSGLEKGVLLEKQQLSKYTYNNILQLGLGLQEFDWTEQFLEDYRSHLDPKERDNLYCYNRAVFYFRKGDYAQAMSLLQDVEFKDLLYNLDARRMLLRMYYEQGYFDALDSLLDSFRVFILRQKKIGYHRSNYLNLIQFMRKILKMRPSDDKARQKLRRQMEQTASLAEKEWLLDIVQSR